MNAIFTFSTCHIKRIKQPTQNITVYRKEDRWAYTYISSVWLNEITGISSMYHRGTSSLSDTEFHDKIHRFIKVHEKKLLNFP